MNSNPLSTALQRFNHRERGLQALSCCAFHMQYRFRITYQHYQLSHLLNRAVLGALSSSKVTRLKGDYEWAAEVPLYVDVPCRPPSRPSLNHGFVLAPIVLQFHWLQFRFSMSSSLVHQERKVPFIEQHDYTYAVDKVVALACCFCQAPCQLGCRTWTWIPIDRVMWCLCQEELGMFARSLDVCLLRNEQFYSMVARMHLLHHISEITVFPRECFYVAQVEDIDDDILDRAYDMTVAALATNPELAAIISWMVFGINVPMRL